MQVDLQTRRVMEPYGNKWRLENKERMKEFFQKRLEKTINENQHRKKLYFITYKIRFDRENPWVAKDIMLVHEAIPQVMIAGTLLYEINNEKGTCELLRVIDP